MRHRCRPGDNALYSPEACSQYGKPNPRQYLAGQLGGLHAERDNPSEAGGLFPMKLVPRVFRKPGIVDLRDKGMLFKP